VSGNGQSELLDVLAGLAVPQAGTLELGGRHFEPAHWLEPTTARALRLAHVPEDRHRRGLVLPFAAWESAVLGHEDLPAYSRRGWMRHGAMRAATADMMQRFDVRPRDLRLPCASFSGGNQQKLVLAREATHAPQVLLVGQPTRGVDIGAIEFIHGRLRAMRDAGGAVRRIDAAGYFGTDAFYEAVPTYTFWFTCNEWTRRALAAAGVRTAWWAPFDIAVMHHLPAGAFDNRAHMLLGGGFGFVFRVVFHRVFRLGRHGLLGRRRSGERILLGITLRQRAWPLVEMLKRSQSEGQDVVWGV
jgi:ABC-type lipoprotein export system ATPase subunit